MDLKLEPVGSIVSYEIMNWVSIGQYLMVPSQYKVVRVNS